MTINWNDLEYIIREKKREFNLVECNPVGGIHLQLAKINNWDVYVYSNQGYIYSVYTYLLANKVCFKGLLYEHSPIENCKYEQHKIDKIENCENSLVIIIADESITHLAGRREKYFLFPVWLAKEKKRKAMVKKLLDNGLKRYCFLEGMELLDVNNVWNIGLYKECGEDYIQKIDEVKRAFDILGDDLSRNLFFEFIRANKQAGIFCGETCNGLNKYFSGKADDELYIHLKDEVWVNCGASLGDTIFIYFANGYSAKLIYAFEGDKHVYYSLLNNIQLLPEQFQKRVNPINCFISDDNNWSSYIEGKISLLNADIEGAEKQLILAMREKIEDDRPVIAICVYHNPEDIYEIPNLISSIVSNYDFVLRKYPCSQNNPKRTSELVFYAIPKERSKVVVRTQL